jgi:sulfane dehydrogenase subunit SoxC
MTSQSSGISREELQLAARNHGMPLEALRYDLTPPGLHYLLIHYDIPEIDPRAWRLEVTGAVERPITLDLESVQARERVSAAVTLECAGNGRALLEPRPVSQPWLLEAVGNARWTGTPLAPLLDEAGIASDANEVAFAGADRGVEGEVEQTYERALPLDEAMRAEVLLAYAMNDQPLLPQHGFPLRLIVPGWYGMTHVKWLTRIEVLREPFTGYQNARGYRMRTDPDDAGEGVSRIVPRALMVPPGIPEFMTRSRIVEAGTVELRGRAWSGLGAITRVEVSDDGSSWWDADLDETPGDPFAWRSWTTTWDARPGDRLLMCRATDATGAAQALDATWNVGGYSNNAVQRVPVLVR